MTDYNPMTHEELYSVIGGTREDFDEALLGLLEMEVLKEHHDGGFIFNQTYVNFLLETHDPDRDLHELYGNLELG